MKMDMSIDIEKKLLKKYSSMRLFIGGDGLGGVRVRGSARVRTGEHASNDVKEYFGALRGRP